MATRSRAEQARRSELRVELSGLSYPELKGKLAAGDVSVADLRTFYSDARSNAMKAVNRINKSDVGFIDEPPSFAKSRDLKTPEQLMAAISEVTKFTGDKGQSTLGGRRQERDAAIDTLHKHGMMQVNAGNFNLWVRFQRWFEQQARQYQYGSDSDAVMEVFQAAEETGADTAADWQELFEIYEEDGMI